MVQNKFDVISPDGFPISCEPFASANEAQDSIPFWCERFKHQGYYSTSSREKISLEELPHRLRIVESE